ncbi:MAG: GDP-L-fucose synthase [Bacteroidia bacterium]|nr:GDP-L-fucose synthase [Bacteroidia bacterium]NNM15177.1 GDP-L-fucose synthase [Bacteroidia bacterium]
MNKDSKIYVAGHRGMVGSAIVRKLNNLGFSNIVVKTSKEVNLTRQKETSDFFNAENPDFVFVAAAKVGGILANNTYRADFIYDNLMIECNVIKAAHDVGVEKLMLLGSSCIYPKMSKQPIKEEYLLSGYLEPTNEPYAIAKIAGLKMCEAYRDQYDDDFISAMPTNLYGPNDNYDLKNSHVLPALIRKFAEAKEGNLDSVEIWGTGSPKREFLHVDDLADACIFLMQNYSDRETVNVGTGVDITIKELAETIKNTIGFTGELKFDTSKPDGTPRKLLDVSKIHSLGWKHKIDLQTGINMVWDHVSEKGFAGSVRI